MGFFDQMKQLQEMKSKADDVKKKLAGIEVTAENSAVKVIVDGNRLLLKVELKDSTHANLANLLKDAVNEAMGKADNIMQSEMMQVTKGMIPGLG